MNGQNLGASNVGICLATLAAFTKMKEFDADEATELTMSEFWSQFVLKLNKEQLEEFFLDFRVQAPKGLIRALRARRTS